MSQRSKLLSALRRGPMTKVQILNRLGILNGGGRVQDLRDAGHRIKTDMVEVRTRYGTSKVARYRLIKEKK